jgi:hypothetical protein
VKTCFYVTKLGLLKAIVNGKKNIRRVYATQKTEFSPTGMFALRNPMSYVSSAAFSQPRLGSAPPHARRGAAKNNLTRNHQLLTKGLFWPLL